MHLKNKTCRINTNRLVSPKKESKKVESKKAFRKIKLNKNAS